MMDTSDKKSSLFSSFVPYSKQDIDVPVTAGPAGSIVSPYLNFDPAYIQGAESQYIYPEGRTGHRGIWEKSFSIIGGSVMAAGGVGGAYGFGTEFFKQLQNKEKPSKLFSIRQEKTAWIEIWNNVKNKGGSGGVTFGVIAVWYTLSHSLLNLARGSEDKWHCIPAGGFTGFMYQLPVVWKQENLQKSLLERLKPVGKGFAGGLLLSGIYFFASSAGNVEL